MKVEERLRTDPAITVFVNNAGIGGPGPIVGNDPDKLERVIDLNVTALTRLATVAATAFAARESGLIINIGSVLGLAPEILPSNYPATKAYVLVFTQSLAQELAPKNVRVQAVLPGATRTEIWERGGKDINSLPAEMLMEVDEMVDAALAGLDQGELVTIPSLPDYGDWERLDAARLHLAPNLSRNIAAARYKTAA
jgi:short-subunit dehydrogenase